MSTRKSSWGSSSAITLTGASLASDTNLLAGRQGDAVDNSSNLPVRQAYSGKFTLGTSPTASRIVQFWAVAKKDDSNWPDAFGATDANRSVTSKDALASYGRLIQEIPTPATSNYVCECSCEDIAALFGFVPILWVPFVVHNTGVNANSTGGNHVHTVKNYFETNA